MVTIRGVVINNYTRPLIGCLFLLLIAVAPMVRGSNEFVGVQEMKRLHQVGEEGHAYGSYEKFLEWANKGDWYLFGPMHHHYDWWMFPIADRSSYGLKYTVTEESVEELKNDEQYMKNYRHAIQLMFQSWGWDIEKGEAINNPDAEEQGMEWRNWDVRLLKVCKSMKLFFPQEDIYISNAFKFIKSIKNQLRDQKLFSVIGKIEKSEL